MTLTFACKWLVMSYNSLICTHLILQMCGVFKTTAYEQMWFTQQWKSQPPRAHKRVQTQTNVRLTLFDLRETLKSCFYVFCKASQNDNFCLFTLNGKVRVLWSAIQIWKIQLQIMLWSSSCVSPNGRQGRWCSSRGHKWTLPGLWSELAPGYRGSLLFSHQMTFITTYPSLPDPHSIWHSVQQP